MMVMEYILSMPVFSFQFSLIHKFIITVVSQKRKSPFTSTDTET